MAENKTKATDLSVSEFLDALENKRRKADASELLAAMQELTGQPVKIWGAS